MRNKITLIVLMAVILIGINGCHSPEEALPIDGRQGINSITASLAYEDSPDNSFPGEIDHENQTITIVFTYNYPKLSDNVLPVEALKKVKIIANIENNIIISPPMGYFDLTKDCYITVTDKMTNDTKEYKIVAEIRKNNECTINHFSIPSKGLTGIIDEKNHIISLISIGDIGEQLAEVTLSHGAILEPDIQNIALNYDEEHTVKVVAQNGEDQLIYTIKKNIPQKVPSGIRPNSGRLLWAKKLSDIGISSLDRATSLGVVDDFVVVNERGNGNAIYLNNQTGEIVGKMDISNIVTGDLSNYYMTSDRANNILICNYTLGANGGTMFTIWKISGVDGQPEKFIEYQAKETPASSERVGWAISITGDLDKNALITTPVFSAGKVQFARWQVINGVLQDQMPAFVEVKSLTAGDWIKSADIVYVDPSNSKSDYFLGGYVRYTEDNKRYFMRYDGENNTLKQKFDITAIANAPTPAVDYMIFNNTPYTALSIIDPFGVVSKTVDIVYMFDVTSGLLVNPIKVCEAGKYGSFATSGVVNAERACDVVLRESKDGYYMYAYMMFGNGYVLCTQFDCIDM